MLIRPSSSPVAGYVYLIRPVGHNVYKIGCSVDVEKRLSRLQRRRGYRLECVVRIWSNDYQALEEALHRHFAARCLIGEWFVLEDQDVAFIRGLEK